MSKLTNVLHSIVGKNHVLALLNIMPLEGSMHGSSITDKVYLKFDDAGNIDYAKSEEDATHMDYAMAKLMQLQLTKSGHPVFTERGVLRNGVPVTVLPGNSIVASGIFRIGPLGAEKIVTESESPVVETTAEQDQPEMRNNNSNFDAELPLEQPNQTVRHYRILSPIGYLGADGGQNSQSFEVTLADGFYEGVWMGEEITVKTRTGGNVSFRATPAQSKPLPVQVTVNAARAYVK